MVLYLRRRQQLNLQIRPAYMAILNFPIIVGTQLKGSEVARCGLDRPYSACSTTSVIQFLKVKIRKKDIFSVVKQLCEITSLKTARSLAVVILYLQNGYLSSAKVCKTNRTPSSFHYFTERDLH